MQEGREGIYKEIMFCIFEDHVYRLVFEKHFFESNDIHMVDFTIQLKTCCQQVSKRLS